MFPKSIIIAAALFAVIVSAQTGSVINVGSVTATRAWSTNYVASATGAVLVAANAYADSVAGGTAAVEAHNTNGAAHADIRASVSNCLTLANMTDGTVDAVGDGSSVVDSPGSFAVGVSSTVENSQSSVVFGTSGFVRNSITSGAFGAGSYVENSTDSFSFGSYAFISGMDSTYAIGAGTAISNGWFHYRGAAVIDDGGRVYGPTGEYLPSLDPVASGTLTAGTVKAPTSAGGALQSNNGSPCLTWGAGGGCNVSTLDGMNVAGALAVGAFSTTGTASVAGDNIATWGGVTNYVESITVPGSIVYGYTNASTYDSAYATLSKTPNPTAQTFSFSGVTNNQYIGSGWLSDDEVKTFRVGAYNVDYWVLWNARSTASATFSTKAELYIWDGVGVVTQEVEEATVQAHAFNVLDDRSGRIYVNTEIERPNGARHLIKLKAVVSAGHTVGGSIYLGNGYQSSFEFPSPAGFYARSSELLEVSNPTPLALTTNMVLFPNKASGPVTCSNQAFTVSISGTGYQTGRANAIYTEITWFTNGTSMTWPTNITWMASTNAPTFADGKRYQIFLSKIDDVGNWLGSVSGAFQ